MYDVMNLEFSAENSKIVHDIIELLFRIIKAINEMQVIASFGNTYFQRKVVLLLFPSVVPISMQNSICYCFAFNLIPLYIGKRIYRMKAIFLFAN